LEEINFIVCEEAFYTNEHYTTTDLTKSVKTTLPNLLKQGIITEDIISTITGIVIQRETLQALEQIEKESFNEKNLLNWKTGSSLSLPKTLEDGTLYNDPLVNKALLDKVELILQLENRKRESRRVINSHNDHIKKIFENQVRLRDNIKSLDKMPSSDLVKRYLKDLDSQEDDLYTTRGKIEVLEAEEAQLDGDLKKLKFEVIDQSKKEKESYMVLRV